MKRFFTLFMSIILILSLASCGSITDTNLINSNKKSGEDYTSLVIDAFWKKACVLFGINYSDFKMMDTATSYISDSTTSDGYTAHYYLVKTSYDTENVFGKKELNKIINKFLYKNKRRNNNGKK